MKRHIFVVLSVILLCVFFAFSVSATDYSDYFSSFDDSLTDSLSDETLDILEQFGIENFDTDELGSVSFSNAVKVIFGLFTNSGAQIAAYIGVSAGIVLLGSFCASFSDGNSSVSAFFETLSVMFISLYSITSVNDLVMGTLSVINSLGVIMKLLLPVLCSIVALSGNPTLATGSSAISFYVSELIIDICNGFLSPVICIFCSFAVCSAVYFKSEAVNILLMLKKIFTTVLGFLGSVYSGVLSIRDSVALALDKVTVKGIQYVLGSSVPIVGGTLSEGLSAGVAALSLFKTTFGLFGLISCIATMLPIFIQLILWQLSLYSCEYFSKAVSASKTAVVFESLRYIMTMLTSLLLFTVFVFMISVATVLIMSKGA